MSAVATKVASVNHIKKITASIEPPQLESWKHLTAVSRLSQISHSKPTSIISSDVGTPRFILKRTFLPKI